MSRTVAENLQMGLAPSRSHLMLADLFARGKVTQIICFNWDHFIEHGRNFPVVIGESNPGTQPGRFWKPHGCTTRPDEPWVFPDQPIRLNPFFRDSMTTRPAAARLAISVGFSGSAGFNRTQIADLVGNVDMLDIRPLYRRGNDLGTPISLGSEYALSWLSKYAT